MTNVKVSAMDSSQNPLSVQIAKHDQWETAQPRIGRGVLPPTPVRMCITGPSGSGKGALVSDLLIRMYRGGFQRIIVASPSVHLDSAWQPVKDYVRTVMGVPEEEECFFDHWDEAKIGEIIETQRKVVEFQKREKASNKLFGICIVVDDFASEPCVMSSRAGGSSLNRLLVRGRHLAISTLILTQKMRACGNLLRINLQALVIFRLRNRLELDSIIEELSAVYDKKTLMEMYKMATAEPYSFMYVNLSASRVEDMFWYKFISRMVPTDSPNALEE